MATSFVFGDLDIMQPLRTKAIKRMDKKGIDRFMKSPLN